jgi:hypothetical protein
MVAWFFYRGTESSMATEELRYFQLFNDVSKGITSLDLKEVLKLNT